VPKPAGDYLKLTEGTHKVRVMTAPGGGMGGYEYWNKDGKPVRSREAFEEMPSDIRFDDKGQPEKIKHFWAFTVWSYDAKRLLILELTQYSIQQAIQNYAEHEDWGSPTEYDLTIKRWNESGFTKYSVTTSPPKPAPAEAITAMKTTKIDLTKLFEGKEPVEHDMRNEAMDAVFAAGGEATIE